MLQITTEDTARVMMANNWFDTPKIGQMVDKLP